MKLLDFLYKYKIKVVLLAVRAGLSPAAIYNILKVKSIPHQKTAERIEKACDGVVTVFELRGEDDRQKKRS